MKIFHISDLHIRSEAKYNFQTESKLYTLKEKLRPSDLIVCTGDITDDGNEKQYSNALRILTPFCGRMILTPGNHDFGAAGNFYNRDCVKRFNVLKELIEFPQREFYDLRILDVDSNRKTTTPFDFARGRVGIWNRHKIKQFGISCKKDKKISLVCMHHTPFEEHWALELEDADELIRACEGYIDYVLVGHEHKKRMISLNREGTQQGTVYYSAPSLADKDGQPVEINITFPLSKLTSSK